MTVERPEESVPIPDEAKQANHQADLNKLVGEYHRTRWALLWIAVSAIAIIVIIGSVYLYQQHQLIKRDEVRISATCAEAYDIGTAPITNAPGQRQPSELGVKIIVDFRNAYVGQQCPGVLPPASPKLLFWADRYGLELKG